MVTLGAAMPVERVIGAQWAMPEAAASSINRPVTNRSS
jgi:hypothetical protein